jgi:hypothetical protein
VANIQESMVNFFSSQSKQLPKKWSTSNYLPNAIRFLKMLGSDGIEEAERLQNLDAPAIYKEVQSLCPELV